MSKGEYWEDRYAKGDVSGEGSVGVFRKWKWSVINYYVNISDKTVLDIGCGDLSFWEGRDLPDCYIGVDISKTLIDRHTANHPSRVFIESDIAVDISVTADIVFCFDVLFHIMDDKQFQKVLNNLTGWTGEYLFICTWRYSPFGRFRNSDGKYQKFRNLDKYLPLEGLELVKMHSILRDPNAVYVFRREASVLQSDN